MDVNIDNCPEIAQYILAKLNHLKLSYGESARIGKTVVDSYIQEYVKRKEKLSNRLAFFANPYSFCQEWDNELSFLEDLKD